MPATAETFVDVLEPAEAFVVCAARVHRALREGTAPPWLCLCNMFQAAEIPHALAPFAFFQAVLAGDPQQSFVAEERCLRFVGRHELQLLQTIAHWQRNPTADPEGALEFVTTASVRRLAAPAGRGFAVELAAAGLWVRTPEHLVTAVHAHSMLSRGFANDHRIH